MAKSWKKRIKKIGRKVQKYTAKAIKPVTGVLSAVGTFLGGPVVGAAIGGLGTASSRFLGATAARDKGLKGKAARTKGRKLARSTFKWAAGGVGVGLAGAGVSGLLGGNLGGKLLGGQLDIFGLGGAKGADAGVTGPGWEEGGYLDKLYDSGSNISGTSGEAAGSGIDYTGAILAGAGQAFGQNLGTKEGVPQSKEQLLAAMGEEGKAALAGAGVDMSGGEEKPGFLSSPAGIAVIAVGAFLLLRKKKSA